MKAHLLSILNMLAILKNYRKHKKKLKQHLTIQLIPYDAKHSFVLMRSMPNMKKFKGGDI